MRIDGSIVFRRALPLLLLLVLTGCGGRTVNNKFAKQLIADNPAAALEQQDIDVLSVSQTGQSAVVEAKVRTAFRLQRLGDRWVIREVKIGHNQWEKLENLTKALERIKIEETRALLEQVAAAVERYRAKNGRVPVFGDYVALSDALYPNYLTSLVRLDAWRRPLQAAALAPDGYRLVSAGPDGKFASGDDIEVSKN
jgi:hypothetical protein